ncbi:MAG: nucleotidyltransferase family protein [bacterium]
MPWIIISATAFIEMIPIEQKILICSATLHATFSQQCSLRHLIGSIPDVNHLINTSFRQGLGSLLYKNLLTSHALDTLPHLYQKRLHTLYYRTALFNLKLIHDLQHILNLLNQKKIHVVLLQGIAIIHQVYHDIALRPMGDIDLWVLPKDYTCLINILISQGYSQDHRYPSLFSKGSTIFDIHTHVLWADRIKASKNLLATSQDSFFLNAYPLCIEGHKALCLDPYDQIVYLSLHALKHNIDKLIWLVDIKMLIEGFKGHDWERLMERARELGQQKTISYILFLLKVYEFTLPKEAHAFLRKGDLRPWGKKILRTQIRKGRLPSWAPPLLLSSGKGLGHSFLFIFETIFPRPYILRQVFDCSHTRTIFVLYVKRLLQLFDIIKKQVREIRQL